MTLVRVLKSTGFEQAGQIVDWRGPIEEYLENGTLELVNEAKAGVQEVTNAVGEEAKKLEPEVEQGVQEVATEAKVLEPEVAPVVAAEIADIKANIAEEEKALENLQTQVEAK